MRRGQQRGGRRGDALALQHPLHDRNGGAVRRIRILSALQHAGVSALETEREHVQRHVRTGFIDYADHPERHRDLPQLQPVWQRTLQQDAPQRRRKRCDVPHIGRNGLNAGIRQHKPVVERRGRVHTRQVLRIGAEQFLLGGYEFIGDCAQHAVPEIVRKAGDAFTGLLGLYE